MMNEIDLHFFLWYCPYLVFVARLDQLLRIIGSVSSFCKNGYIYDENNLSFVCCVALNCKTAFKMFMGDFKVLIQFFKKQVSFFNFFLGQFGFFFFFEIIEIVHFFYVFKFIRLELFNRFNSYCEHFYMQYFHYAVSQQSCSSKVC